MKDILAAAVGVVDLGAALSAALVQSGALDCAPGRRYRRAGGVA